MNKQVDCRRGSPANLFSFLVLKYAYVVAPQPEYTTSGCYEIGGPGGSARGPSSRRLVALSINMRHANAIVPEMILDLAAEFLNKLAGCDFGKLLNITVLQKCVPAKSHEKTWELAGRFLGVKPCNWLIFNE